MGTYVDPALDVYTRVVKRGTISSEPTISVPQAPCFGILVPQAVSLVGERHGCSIRVGRGYLPYHVVGDIRPSNHPAVWH